MKLVSKEDLGAVTTEMLIEELLCRYDSAVLCWVRQHESGVFLRSYEFKGCSSTCIGVMQYAIADLVQPTGVEPSDLGIEE